MKKFCLLLAASFVTAALAVEAPVRVGPVSEYGKLMVGKNSSGKGRIYGSCKGALDGAEVQVRGMSLYWSLKDEAIDFWSDAGVTSMVNDMKIQIVRAAMATGSENWSDGKYIGYAVQPEAQKNFVKTVVEAAIKQDIYVIIDWHSHEANNQTESAKAFFGEMAQLYGNYDNVIFELFNEPTDIPWATIKNYANQVIPEIRKHSDNLILVGTRAWDQNPNEVIGNEVNDPAHNTAYTLHYYAASHCVKGSYDWGGECEGAKGQKAIDAGISVFISEWGTGSADGGGSPDAQRNAEWQNFINENKLSWANWSASRISEGTAAFTSNSTATSLSYTASGNVVKGFLATNPETYTKCSTGAQEPLEPNSSASSEAIKNVFANSLSVTQEGRALLISENAFVDVLDMQGRPLVSFSNVHGAVLLNTLSNGEYIVRVRTKENSLIRRIVLK